MQLPAQICPAGMHCWPAAGASTRTTPAKPHTQPFPWLPTRADQGLHVAHLGSVRRTRAVAFVAAAEWERIRELRGARRRFGARLRLAASW